MARANHMLPPPSIKELRHGRGRWPSHITVTYCECPTLRRIQREHGRSCGVYWPERRQPALISFACMTSKARPASPVTVPPEAWGSMKSTTRVSRWVNQSNRVLEGDPSIHPLTQMVLTASFVINVYAMKTRRRLFSILISLIALTFIASAIPTGAQRTTKPAQRRATTSTRSPRDEALWQKALAIHRRAFVIDTHNDITTSM